MHHRSPANIPQRILDWWKSRSKEDTSTSSPDDAVESEGGTSLCDRATDIGGRARNVAGGVQSRGKGAVEELRRRRQGETASDPDETQRSATRIGDRARGAASGAGAIARGAVTRASGMRTGSQTGPVEGGMAESSTPDQSSGSGSTERETPLDTSSVAWASTAGVIDPVLGNPSSFIDAEQNAASESAQDTGDPDATPGDRAAVTPHVDTTAQAAGNAEEGTRNESASAATRASTNTPEDKPLVQAPDDPIGDSEDRTPGTGSAETSSEPFAYASSGDSTSRDRGVSTTSGESAAASRPSHAGSSEGEIGSARASDPTTVSKDRSSGRHDTGETKAPEPAPVGDDGLPVYFDTDDSTRSAAQSSGIGGSDTGDARTLNAAASRERPALGAMSDDGSSIAELEAEISADDPGIQSQSTTLSGDAYRSTAAPEAVEPDDGDAGDARHPGPGSSIPNFATDADSPTRIVESPADSGNISESKTRRKVGSIVSENPGDERQAGSGVTMSEPTSQVPGDAEPVPDPASGRARASGDIGRRGVL